MKTFLAATVLLVLPQQALSQIIPNDRLYPWQDAGLLSTGGIPTRTTICKTLAPRAAVGADDSTRINNAIAACPAGQVVFLEAGTFITKNYVQLSNSVTLRGAGAGQTILKKPNGAKPRETAIVKGTTGIHVPRDPSTYTYDEQPNIVAGYQRWPVPDSTTSVNLTQDGAAGSYSVTLNRVVGYSPGQIVLIDELSGASWQATPPGYGCSDNSTPSPCPPYVWREDPTTGGRVAWTMHWSEQQYIDDNAYAAQCGPYDNPPACSAPPAAMSWFSRTDRPINEIKQIASISGDTITFTTPLSLTYRASHQAQVTAYTNSANGGNGAIHLFNASVENMTLVGGAAGSLRFENCAFCWAYNVEVTQWIGEGIAVEGSYRVQLEGNYVHTGSNPTPGGGGYAISLANGSAEILIQNNITIDINKNIVCRASGTGSVIAYNYFDDPWISYQPDWVEVSDNCSHLAGSHHVLHEGNYAVNADSDYTHGNSSYQTFLRNYYTTVRKDFPDVTWVSGNIRGLSTNYGAWWYSFVGNVIGIPGKMAGYDLTDPSMGCDANGDNCKPAQAGNWDGNYEIGNIYQFGSDDGDWNAGPDPYQYSGAQELLKYGNYDFLTNKQHDMGSNPIPNSLYLTQAPAFFGSNPWPWVDPSTGTLHALPAQSRYVRGCPNNLSGC
jgi:hypothetical protein